MIKEKKAYIVSSIILAIAALICLIAAVQVSTRGYVKIGGYSMFRVITGSMEPAISTGAVLINKETKIEEIEVNDIICYRTRVAEIYGSIVTHRVVAKQKDGDGNIHLETRGDANLTSDPFYVEEEDLIGKVTWYSGKDSIWNDILSFITGKIGFLLCIVFPVLMVSGLILQSAVKSLQSDLALVREELAKQTEAQAGDRSQLLPGYETLTYADYDAIYETLKKELQESLDGRNQEKDTDSDIDTDSISSAGDSADLCHDSSLVYQCGEDQ